MADEELHPLDAAAAAYRRRAHMLGLTDVRPFEQRELDAWADQDASTQAQERGSARGTRPPRHGGPRPRKSGTDHLG